MVTPTPIPSFEAYFGLTQAAKYKEVSKNNKALIIGMSIGLVAVTVLTVHFSIKNLKLKRIIKRIAPEELSED